MSERVLASAGPVLALVPWVGLLVGALLLVLSELPAVARSRRDRRWLRVLGTVLAGISIGSLAATLA